MFGYFAGLPDILVATVFDICETIGPEFGSIVGLAPIGAFHGPVGLKTLIACAAPAGTSIASVSATSSTARARHPPLRRPTIHPPMSSPLSPLPARPASARLVPRGAAGHTGCEAVSGYEAASAAVASAARSASASSSSGVVQCASGDDGGARRDHSAAGAPS